MNVNCANVAPNVDGGHSGTNTINDIPVVHEASEPSSSLHTTSTNEDTNNTKPARVIGEASSSSSTSVIALAPRPPRSDFLVSEHEDNDDQDLLDDVEDSGSTIIVDETNTNATSGNSSIEVAASNSTSGQPTEIPLEQDELPSESPPSDNESDYEYDYEDDDDGQYSGFLITQPAFQNSTISTTSATIVPQDTTHILPPMRRRENIVEEDEDVSLDGSKPIDSRAMVRAAPPAASDSTPPKSKWKEPSQQAISMSLRAEKETTGGRRRLAADLYKIMMHDTEEAGFSIAPQGEDRMDTWTIRLFKFDEDSNLHRDLAILGLDHVELEMNFPGQYPFEPPFVRVVRPRFKRQTGFVMNGALCMELLTTEGWNPVNDIESVIVSIRSLLVVGDGRLQAVVDMPPRKQEALQEAACRKEEGFREEEGIGGKRKRKEVDVGGDSKEGLYAGQYTTAEAKAAYSHLSNFHKKKGWSHWWAKKG